MQLVLRVKEGTDPFPMSDIDVHLLAEKGEDAVALQLSFLPLKAGNLGARRPPEGAARRRPRAAAGGTARAAGAAPSPPHLSPRLRSLRRRRWRRLLLPAGLFLGRGAVPRRGRQQQRGRQEQGGGPRERRQRRQGPHGGRARS